jgi:predicted nucleotidyltransferase component of viral defense system
MYRWCCEEYDRTQRPSGAQYDHADYRPAAEVVVISRDELLLQAEAFDLNEADIQRDYLFGWIISGIFRESNLGARATLKGGNALRKGYLPGTRFSDDLDFSTRDAMDGDAVLTELNRVCQFASDATGVRFDIARNRMSGQQQIDRQRHVYKYQLYFKDMIGQQDHVTISIRVDMTEYDQLYLPVQERQLIHPYSDADACAATIRCVQLEEALADKLKCLLQRRYCYDLFDLVYGTFIAQEVEVNRSELMNVFLRKTIFGSSPRAALSLLLDLPVDLYRGYWNKVLVPAASRLSFDAAIEKLNSGLADLFAPYAAGGRNELAFYPSRLRNPILEAGANRKLIRVTYHGATRIMEPYSLVFKRRTSDGVAQEYFYAYDRTGGNSGPGIKTLMHYDVQSLDVLDEVFEPRFEVTLAKAGDSSQSGYFTGTRGPRTYPFRAPSRPARTRTGPTYIIQCGTCNKRFTRTTRTTQMNKHKNPWGSPCPGRRGYILAIH